MHFGSLHNHSDQHRDREGSPFLDRVAAYLRARQAGRTPFVRTHRSSPNRERREAFTFKECVNEIE